MPRGNIIPLDINYNMMARHKNEYYSGDYSQLWQTGHSVITLTSHKSVLTMSSEPHDTTSLHHIDTEMFL